MLMSGGYLLFRGQLTAIGTVKKVGDRLYTMTYKGDYGFDAFLKKGGAASDAEVGDHITEFLSHGFYKVKPQTQSQGCSTVHAKGENGGYLFGRNYDWKDCTVMVVQTKPENGYASVSTCNMDFWDLERDTCRRVLSTRCWRFRLCMFRSMGSMKRGFAECLPESDGRRV